MRGAGHDALGGVLDGLDGLLVHFLASAGAALVERVSGLARLGEVGDGLCRGRHRLLVVAVDERGRHAGGLGHARQRALALALGLGCGEAALQVVELVVEGLDGGRLRALCVPQVGLAFVLLGPGLPLAGLLLESLGLGLPVDRCRLLWGPGSLVAAGLRRRRRLRGLDGIGHVVGLLLGRHLALLPAPCGARFAPPCGGAGGVLAWKRPPPVRAAASCSCRRVACLRRRRLMARRARPPTGRPHLAESLLLTPAAVCASDLA